MSAPRFRRYATPLGIALISAITGRSIGVKLQPVLGIWAAVIGTAILVTGLGVAIFTWRRRRK